MAKGESKDAPAGTSVADAYAEWAASAAEAGISGLDGRGAASASAPSGGSREASTPSVGEAPNAPSVGRSATTGGPNLGEAPGLFSAAGINPPSVSARSAEDRSMASLSQTTGLYGGQPTQRQAEDTSMTAPGLMPSFREAETMSMNRNDALQAALATIRGAEGGYKSVGYASPYGRPTRDDLTSMTLAEILAFQEEMDGTSGKRLSPRSDRTYLGAYQIGRSTLSEAIARTGLDPNTTKFTKGVQDQLAMDLIDNRARQALRDGVVDPEAFANQLANEWAGLANSSGRSAYHGRAGNAASVGYSTVLDLARDLVETGAVGSGGKAPSRTRSGAPDISLPNPGPIPGFAPDDRPRADLEITPSPRPDTGGFSGGMTPRGQAYEAGPANPFSVAPGFGAFMVEPQVSGRLGIGADAYTRSQYGPASPDRPDNRNASGPRGLGGPGGLYVAGKPESTQEAALRDYARSDEWGSEFPTFPAERERTPWDGAPSPRSLESNGGLLLDFIPEDMRGSPERVETAPEQPPADDIDPGQSNRDKWADRIDRAIPWASPALGELNRRRGEQGKETFGGWLVDLFGDNDGIQMPQQRGEGPSVVTTNGQAQPPIYRPYGDDDTMGGWIPGIFLEPDRPTPREKWSR